MDARIEEEVQKWMNYSEQIKGLDCLMEYCNWILEHYDSTGFYIGLVYLNISIYSANLEIIDEIKTYLEQNGFNSSAFVDNNEHKQRVYNFTKDNKDLQITCWFSQNSKCNFIQVGERTVPIFEFKCADEIEQNRKD